MKRDYYEDIGYKPFLFYVVFGVSGDDLKVSGSRHHVDGIPESLGIHALSRPEHADYLDSFLGGPMGKILSSQDSALYDVCAKAEKCVILKGEIQEDSTLDYMRNVIGIVEAFVENGAVGILDLLTFSLISPADWTGRFFEKDINAQNHVVILCSPEESGKSFWLHTRGMAKFGRPDISVHDVSEDKLNDYKQVIDQMVFYSGKGLFFKGSAKLHTFSGKAFSVTPEFVNDFENEDFNNAYYNVSSIEEVAE